MNTAHTLIARQWLICSTLLMLGTMLCLPAQYWLLVILPLLCIGKQCWHKRAPGRATLSGLFALWLCSFATALWL